MARAKKATTNTVAVATANAVPAVVNTAKIVKKIAGIELAELPESYRSTSTDRLGKVAVLQDQTKVLVYAGEEGYTECSEAQNEALKQKRQAVMNTVISKIGSTAYETMMSEMHYCAEKSAHIRKLCSAYKDERNDDENKVKACCEEVIKYYAEELFSLNFNKTPGTQLKNGVETVYVKSKRNKLIVDLSDPRDVKIYRAKIIRKDGKTYYRKKGEPILCKGGAKDAYPNVTGDGWMKYELALILMLYFNSNDPKDFCKLLAWSYGDNYVNINHKKFDLSTGNVNDLEICTTGDNNNHRDARGVLDKLLKDAETLGFNSNTFTKNHFRGLSVRDTAAISHFKSIRKPVITTREGIRGLLIDLQKYNLIA
jgi:hypothetical protein